MSDPNSSVQNKILTGILIVLTFSLLFVGYFHQVTAFTQDLGRHLLLGKIILTTKSVPNTNLLSYTYPDFPFLNHHYLSEVIFFLLFQIGGSLMLLLLVTFTALISFGLEYFYLLKRSNIIPLSITAFLLIMVLFERTDIRPEIFSFLFLSIFVTILYLNRERQTKLIYLLPLLMLLWTNMHIYFLVGIVIVICFLFDGIFFYPTKQKNKYLCRMLIILFASFLATLITPHGLNGALYPFKVFQNYGYTIEENQSIFFLESLGHQKQSVFFFKMAVFLLFLSLFINLKKTKLIDWFLAMVFTTAGALAVRNLPLFSLAVFIPFTYHFNTLASKVYLVLVRNEFPSTLKRSIKLSVIILLIGLLIWQILNVAREKNFGFSQTVGAEKAADFFLRNNLKGPIFNNFDIGSYIAYRLYPKEKVFVDGRPEAYPASFFRQDYIPMQEDIKRFNELDKKYRFNTIFFTHTDQTPWAISFLQQIITHPAWRIIYLDETAIMLVKNIEQNRSVIDQFAMSPTALSPQYDKKSMRSLLQLASFFSKIGDIKNEALIYQQILKLNPNDCLALRNISIITIQQQDPVSLAYITRFQQTCGRKLIQ